MVGIHHLKENKLIADFNGKLSVIVPAQRLDNFYTWLSNTKPTEGQPLNTTMCTLCLQFSGRVQANIPAVLNCPVSLPAFRYVIIQSYVIGMAICLYEIQVFVCKLKVVSGGNLSKQKLCCFYAL